MIVSNVDYCSYLRKMGYVIYPNDTYAIEIILNRLHKLNADIKEMTKQIDMYLTKHRLEATSTNLIKVYLKSKNTSSMFADIEEKTKQMNDKYEKLMESLDGRDL